MRAQVVTRFHDKPCLISTADLGASVVFGLEWRTTEDEARGLELLLTVGETRQLEMALAVAREAAGVLPG